MQKSNKVAIVGCGNVGMTAAYSILHGSLVNELLLVGRCIEDVRGEELDLEHGMSFLHSAKVRSTINYADLVDSDIVIFTAGAAQKPGETRLDLAQKNTAILESIIPKIVQYAPSAIILIVTNPVDVLTYKAYQIAKLPKGRIFGSGTVLDTSRFRFHLSEFLKVNPRSIHTYILGEHGDTSFPVLSSANVGGQPLMAMNNFSQDRVLKAYEQARVAAYKIIEAKGATYYAIGAVIAHIVRTILSDAKTILPVSVPLHNYYGFSGVALSVPCVVGRDGVEETLEVKLSWDEKQKLEKSVRAIRQYL